jgi:lipid II:glycine glycyltransferase (peptidoglycan interpeptide bridge formation enzyme)
MNNKATYRSLPELQQQLPVFFQPWWLDLVSKHWDVALADNNGVITGVWPFAIDTKIGLKLVRNPLLTPYQGPLFFYPEQLTEEQKANFEQATFQQLWQQIPRWDSFDIEAGLSFTNRALFSQKGLDVIDHITYEIDLQQPEEKLFSAFHTNHRSLIKQALLHNKVVEGETSLSKLLALHKETFSRKKKPYPFHSDMIEKLVTESLKREAGNLFATIDEENNITACIFTVWDSDKMYLLLSTVDLEHAHPGAVRLLIWQAIKAARDKGLKIFDFEGSMDPGIEAFFRRFGGARKTYLYASKNKSLLWKIKKTILG